MIHEEFDPEELAEYSKKHGNASFKEMQLVEAEMKKTKDSNKRKELNTKRKMKFDEAIKRYTEGIDAKCDNMEINIALLNNRAAVHLTVKNYGSCVKDCEAAKSIGSKNIKTFVRGAKSTFALEKYTEAIEWCDDGLEIESLNEELRQLRQKSNSERNRIEKLARRKEKELKALDKKDEALVKALKARGVTVRESLFSESVFDHEKYRGVEYSDSKGVSKTFRCQASKYVEYLKGSSDVTSVFLEKINSDQVDGVLHWPVCFMYPEYKQSDFVSDFAEFNTLDEHLEAMFPSENNAPEVQWDRENSYHNGKFNVYFETARPDPSDQKAYVEATFSSHSKTRLVKVKTSKSLVEVLSDRRFSVVGGTPTFYVVVKGSMFESVFLKRHES